MFSEYIVTQFSFDANKNLFLTFRDTIDRHRLDCSSSLIWPLSGHFCGQINGQLNLLLKIACSIAWRCLCFQIYPQSGTNTDKAVIDTAAGMIDGAIAADIGSAALKAAGRPEPPPAGKAPIYLVVGICISSLCDCIICSGALTRAGG